MANRNDYNYYKNEYGKYKESYYSPGSEEYKKRKNNSMKQKVGRYLRAAVVFLVIAAAVVGIVFGIIGLTNLIADKTPEVTTSPVESTTVPEDVTNKNEPEFKKGAVCIVKTEEGNGVNLRSEPTYDVPAYQLVADGEKIVIAEISKDGKWCKTSNFKNNGWLNLKYLVLSDEEETTEEITTEAETTTKPEVTTEGSTLSDNSITSYDDAIKAFKEKGKGAVMNCKIVGNGTVYAMSKPDPSSTKLLYLVAGNEAKVIDINGSYSKVQALGYEGWVPNENLTFVSWAN